MSQNPTARDSTTDSRSALRRMMVLGAPMIATQYATVIMQFVDAWMLGALGSAELAAIGPAGLLVQVILHFGGGYLSGVITLVAHSLGCKDARLGAAYAKQGITAAIVGGVVFLALWPFAESIFRHFAPNDIVMRYEIAYFQVSLLSIAPQLVAIALANFFIGIQKTGIAMVGSLVGIIANAFFNYILIFGGLGITPMGFIGAAWGTVAASLLQAGLMLALFAWWRHTAVPHNATPSYLDRAQTHWLRLLRLGIPAGIQNAVDILSWGVLLMFLIKPFGQEHQAAATILMRCMQISFLPSDGFAAALHTLVSEALGRQDVHSARRHANVALRTIVSYMVSMGLAFYFFRIPILTFFSPENKEVIHIGAQAMIFVSIFQLFDAFNVTYINALHGAGDTLWPSVVNAILCLVILLGGGLFVINTFPQFGSLGVWCISSIYILFQGIFFFLRWKSEAWHKHSDSAIDI